MTGTPTDFPPGTVAIWEYTLRAIDLHSVTDKVVVITSRAQDRRRLVYYRDGRVTPGACKVWTLRPHEGEHPDWVKRYLAGIERERAAREATGNAAFTGATLAAFKSWAAGAPLDAVAREAGISKTTLRDAFVAGLGLEQYRAIVSIHLGTGNKGRSLSEEHRERISQSQRRSREIAAVRLGSNAPLRGTEDPAAVMARKAALDAARAPVVKLPVPSSWQQRVAAMHPLVASAVMAARGPGGDTGWREEDE